VDVIGGVDRVGVVIGDPSCFGDSFGEVDGSRPLSDFLFPRIGFGPPDKSGEAGRSPVEVLFRRGLTMRGCGLLEPLFGVDVERPGPTCNRSRLVRLLTSSGSQLCRPQNSP